MLKVCVFGPESTGKSTLVKWLADHYETNFAPEYALTYLKKCKGVTELVTEDFIAMAKGQTKFIEDVAEMTDRILFSDTDAMLCKIWSQILIGRSSPIIDDLAKSSPIDFYLLTDLDQVYASRSVCGIKMIQSTTRHKNRVEFMHRSRKMLMEMGKNYRVVRGSGDMRNLCAVSAINDFANKNGKQLHDVYLCT